MRIYPYRSRFYKLGIVWPAKKISKPVNNWSQMNDREKLGSVVDALNYRITSLEKSRFLAMQVATTVRL